MSFEEKVACVTGAGSGIGRALALALVRSGARVVITDVSARGLDETLQQIVQQGKDACVVEADIRDFESMQVVASTAIKTFRQLDLWINCAGISRGYDPLTLTEENFSEFIDVNLMGTINGARAAMPAMLKRRQGAIVNIASATGFLATSGWLPYAVSKFGVVGYSEGLHAALAGHGVHLSLVCPLWVDTPMNQSTRKDPLEDAPTGWAGRLMRAVLARLRQAPMSPERAAERILRGVQRKRYHINTHRWFQLLLIAKAVAPETFARLWVRTNASSLPTESSALVE